MMHLCITQCTYWTPRLGGVRRAQRGIHAWTRQHLPDEAERIGPAGGLTGQIQDPPPWRWCPPVLEVCSSKSIQWFHFAFAFSGFSGQGMQIRLVHLPFSIDMLSLEETFWILRTFTPMESQRKLLAPGWAGTCISSSGYMQQSIFDCMWKILVTTVQSLILWTIYKRQNYIWRLRQPFSAVIGALIKSFLSHNDLLSA